jgi:cytochrome c1
MEDREFRSALSGIVRSISVIVGVLSLLLMVVLAHYFLPKSFSEGPAPTTQIVAEPEDENLIKDGVHVKTGLLEGEGLRVVITHCTACHSAKLITQNRATKDGWRNMIRWMQQTQNLWELGDNEEIILNYLATQYAPQKKGRRSNLKNIEWYELE